jgi:hypothetical protein
MNHGWFANKGQIVQVLASLASVILAGTSIYLALENRTFSTGAKTVFFFLGVAVVGVAVGLIMQLVARHGSSVNERVPNFELPTPFLTMLDKEPSRQPDSGVTYKFKLYIILRNDSAQYIETVAGTWEPGDVGLPLSQQLWQIEGTGGWQTGSWQPEQRGELQNVRPTQVLRTWIPLVPAIQDADVRRNIVQKRVGTLVIHLKVAGRILEAQRIRL